MSHLFTREEIECAQLIIAIEQLNAGKIRPIPSHLPQDLRLWTQTDLRRLHRVLSQLNAVQTLTSRVPTYTCSIQKRPLK